MTPEFSRRIAIDTIGSAPREVSIEATDAERAALARRFDLVAVAALSAKVQLSATALGVAAKGRLTAAVTQACVVTGEPVVARLDEAFALRFADSALPDTLQEDVELASDDCDVLEIDGGAIDLGEATAQTLALSLDPFPRSPAASATPEQRWTAGEEAGPFAALKGLL